MLASTLGYSIRKKKRYIFNYKETWNDKGWINNTMVEVAKRKIICGCSRNLNPKQKTNARVQVQLGAQWPPAAARRYSRCTSTRAYHSCSTSLSKSDGSARSRMARSRRSACTWSRAVGVRAELSTRVRAHTRTGGSTVASSATAAAAAAAWGHTLSGDETDDAARLVAVVITEVQRAGATGPNSGEGVPWCAARLRSCQSFWRPASSSRCLRVGLGAGCGR